MAKELGNIHKEYWHVLEISEALEYGDLFHIFIIYSTTTVLPESYRNFKNLPWYYGKVYFKFGSILPKEYA
uniref:Uncharacterized protein n=1 Tax=Rhizophagus irregularis (strain DAOM 181602 / DAOM 197198 / MUCL 43194) TaxID=747089 RepID=U9U075_RHIID